MLPVDLINICIDYFYGDTDKYNNEDVNDDDKDDTDDNDNNDDYDGI